MAIKKYFASADTTISNAFDQSLLSSNSATGSNMGAADILEAFQIYGQVSSSSGLSSELSRILVQFDTTEIATDRSSGVIPASSNVSFYLKLYNAEHSSTLPENFDLTISAVSQSWQEGNGLDMVNYTDKTYNGTGSNWQNASGIPISEITKFVFSGVETDYAAGSAQNYVKLYNGSTLYNVWFSGSLPASAGSTGNWVKVDFSSLSNENATHKAQELSSSLTAAGFTVSHEGGTAYVTASAGKATAHAEIEGTLSELTLTVEVSGANFTAWNSAGGDYHASPTFNKNFYEGYENLSVDVTSLVEEWLDGTKTNYGFGIKLKDNLEAETKSYYTKKFFARGSEFYFKRPCLEARWDNTVQDDRESFFLSSSLAPAEDNLNTIYLYNVVRGRLRNIPSIGTDSIYVSIYSGSADNTEPDGSPLDMVADATHVVSARPKVVTGSYVSTGVYAATFAFTGSSELTKVYDVWFSGSENVTSSAGIGVTQFHTGTINVNTLSAEIYNPSMRYILSLSNLRENYGPNETARFKLYARPRDWNPTIYTKASNVPETTIITSASYEIFRATDGLKVIPFGTGSDYHTGLSYNVSGNYFDLNMSNLEKGYTYGVRFSFYDDAVGSWNTQPYEFNFKVRNDEY